MRAAALLPASCNLFLPLLEVSVREFPYGAGVPATLKPPQPGACSEATPDRG
jgi:hypothetical protein